MIRLVERLRDEPMKEICRDPRDGTKFGNTHVVRSSAVRTGLVTPGHPDGRLAGTPLASSVAASVGRRRAGRRRCSTPSANWMLPRAGKPVTR